MTPSRRGTSVCLRSSRRRSLDAPSKDFDDAARASIADRLGGETHAVDGAGAGQGIGQAWEFYDTFEGHLVDDGAVKDNKARYVRFYSNGSTADDLNRYTEVAVYGIPAE